MAKQSTGSRAAEGLGWNSQDLSNFRNVKIVLALRIGTDRAFHKAGPAIKKALDLVLVFIRETTNLFELEERRYILIL